MKTSRSKNLVPTALLLGGSLAAHAGEAGAVPTQAEDICPIKIGSRLPRLTVETMDGKSFDLNAAIARKPTVLIFYRGGWCPYCNLQMGQLQTVEPQLLKLGYQLLAVSADAPAELRKSLQKHGMKSPCFRTVP